jgi:ubiquinone/menaquinone biosynthesis C-methylase UbiE
MREIMATIDKAVHTNYNPTGIAIIEKLYGAPGYLSPGGPEATDALASRISLSPDDHVLDVGSGVGGPAMRLAQHNGCKVTGLELVATSVEFATARVAEAGMEELVSFECGDATAIPFADDMFSVVWSQDAWCHIDRRQDLLDECARVIAPGGTLLFSDWLFTGVGSEASRAKIFDALSAPSLATLDEYCELVGAAGFNDIEPVDDSARFAGIYHDAMLRIAAQRQAICDEFSERVYDIVMEKNQCLADGFKSGLVGGGSIRARAPML